MGRRVTVASLVGVKERDWPMLLYKDYEGLRGDHPVLHICRRDGHHPLHPKLNIHHFYHITECNRPLRHVSYLPDRVLPLLEGFKLCKRCGDQAAFDEAFADMLVGWAARCAQIEAERDQREADRLQAKADRLERMCRLQAALGGTHQYLNPFGSGVRIGSVGIKSGNLYIWYEGVRFQVVESPES